MTARAIPRALHPGAWWLWGLGLATAASRTNNLLLLALIVAVAGFVVAARRTTAPWSRAFRASLVLGAVVIAVRLVFEVVFGTDPGPQHARRAPRAAAAVVGGRGRHRRTGHPRGSARGPAGRRPDRGDDRLRRRGQRPRQPEPAAQGGAGRPLRGGGVRRRRLDPRPAGARRTCNGCVRPDGYAVAPTVGSRGLATVALPALEGALHRSLHLAASMDARGYGRQADVPARTRRLTAALVLGGLTGLVISLYGLLDAGSPVCWASRSPSSDSVLAAAGFRLAGRRSIRTRYRPDPWRGPEWLTIDQRRGPCRRPRRLVRHGRRRAPGAPEPDQLAHPAARPASPS